MDEETFFRHIEGYLAGNSFFRYDEHVSDLRTFFRGYDMPPYESMEKLFFLFQVFPENSNLFIQQNLGRLIETILKERASPEFIDGQHALYFELFATVTEILKKSNSPLIIQAIQNILLDSIDPKTGAIIQLSVAKIKLYRLQVAYNRISELDSEGKTLQFLDDLKRRGYDPAIVDDIYTTAKRGDAEQAARFMLDLLVGTEPKDIDQALQEYSDSLSLNRANPLVALRLPAIIDYAHRAIDNREQGVIDVAKRQIEELALVAKDPNVAVLFEGVKALRDTNAVIDQALFDNIRGAILAGEFERARSMLAGYTNPLNMEGSAVPQLFSRVALEVNGLINQLKAEIQQVPRLGVEVERLGTELVALQEEMSKEGQVEEIAKLIGDRDSLVSALGSANGIIGELQARLNEGAELNAKLLELMQKGDDEEVREAVGKDVALKDAEIKNLTRQLSENTGSFKRYDELFSFLIDRVKDSSDPLTRRLVAEYMATLTPLDRLKSFRKLLLRLSELSTPDIRIGQAAEKLQSLEEERVLAGDERVAALEGEVKQLSFEINRLESTLDALRANLKSLPERPPDGFAPDPSTAKLLKQPPLPPYMQFGGDIPGGVIESALPLVHTGWNVTRVFCALQAKKRHPLREIPIFCPRLSESERDEALQQCTNGMFCYDASDILGQFKANLQNSFICCRRHYLEISRGLEYRLSHSLEFKGGLYFFTYGPRGGGRGGTEEEF